MPTQLHFEPSATQIGNDTWLVVPKNNSDTIVIGEETVYGTYKLAMKCNTLAKDIILALWGTPELNENDQLCSDRTKTQIVSDLCDEYENVWTADEITGKFIIEGSTPEENLEYDTLEDAMRAQVNLILQILAPQAPAPAPVEEGGDQNA